MTRKKLLLHHFPGSRSTRVRWALHETVGDDFELHRVDLYGGEQYAPEYLASNPNHNVPVLEITFAGGATHCMLESVAMVEWLVDAFPEKQLAPAIELSAARADYLQMLHFGGSWMDMMLWQIRVHEHILPSDQVDQRTIDRYRKKFVREVEPQLLARLQSRPFVCGKQFSGADIVIGHNVVWARAYQLCEDPVFEAYLLRLGERPAFQLAFSDINEFQAEVPNRELLKGVLV